MSCRRERKRIQWLMDGDISTAERARLDLHLKKCESCRTHMEEMTSLRKFAGMRKLETRSEAYWRSYWPRLKPKLAEKRVRRPLSVGRLLRNPAFELAVVVAIVLVAMVRFNIFVFESPIVRRRPMKIVEPLRGPEAYQHILGSASGYSPGLDERPDRVIYPDRRVPHEYVLAPARGVEGAAWNETIAI